MLGERIALLTREIEILGEIIEISTKLQESEEPGTEAVVSARATFIDKVEAYRRWAVWTRDEMVDARRNLSQPISTAGRAGTRGKSLA